MKSHSRSCGSSERSFQCESATGLAQSKTWRRFVAAMKPRTFQQLFVFTWQCSVNVALLAGLAFVSTGRAVTNPVVACATTTRYANVTDPFKLSFAPDGTLYVGRDNVGSGGTHGDPVKIHRVAPGGSPVTEYGNVAIADPDAVGFDTLGIVSGTPGAVLVGSASGPGASIFKINTNGVVTTLFGGAQTNMANPGELFFDTGGVLYISDFGSNRVFKTASPAAPTNLLLYLGAYALALDVSNRLAVGAYEGGGLALYSTNGAPLGAFPSIRRAGAPIVAGPGDAFWGRELYSVSANEELIRIDSFGNAVVMGTGFDGFISMAFGPDHALYVSYLDYDVILRIAPVTTPAPDHWWRGDGDASNAVSTAHGTATNVTYAPGRFGQAFSFDGTFASQVTFGTNAGNFGTRDFTIALWLKTTTSNTLNTQFLAKRANCFHENFWSLAMAGGPYIELDQDNQGNNYFSAGANLSATAVVADTQWHHLAFVRRGGEGLFYRDAVLVGLKATNFVTQLTNTALLRANTANCQAFGAVPLSGLLDEIKIYGCALSASQIAESAGLPDPTRPTLNIVRLPGAVQLSWTTNATGYLLETNAALSLINGWNVLTSNYSVLNTNYAVTNTMSGAAKFYRLRKP
jgi:hypothetical protein